MNNLMIEEMMKGLDQAIDKALREDMMTLGEFIEKLESIEKSKPIIFAYPPDPEGKLDYSEYEWNTYFYDQDHLGLGKIDSYRGYYRYLAIEPSKHVSTVEDALNNAKSVLNQTLEGYKGGDFFMDKDTLIWCAYWGSAAELMIIGVHEYDEKVVVRTDFEKDDKLNHEQIAKDAEKSMYEKIGRQVMGTNIKYTVEVGQLTGSKPTEDCLTFQKQILGTETFRHSHVKIPEGNNEIPSHILAVAETEAIGIARKHEEFYNNISRDIEPDGYWTKPDHEKREIYHYWHEGFELCHYIRLQWSKI